MELNTTGSLCCCPGVLHLRCWRFFLTLVAFLQPGRRGLQRVCSSVPEARATPQQREGAARPCIVCCLGSFSVQTCYSFVVKTRLETATGYSLKFWIPDVCIASWTLLQGLRWALASQPRLCSRWPWLVCGSSVEHYRALNVKDPKPPTLVQRARKAERIYLLPLGF